MESKIKGVEYHDYARRLREFSDIVGNAGSASTNWEEDREQTTAALMRMAEQMEHSGCTG